MLTDVERQKGCKLEHRDKQHENGCILIRRSFELSQMALLEKIHNCWHMFFRDLAPRQESKLVLMISTYGAESPPGESISTLITRIYRKQRRNETIHLKMPVSGSNLDSKDDWSWNVLRFRRIALDVHGYWHHLLEVRIPRDWTTAWCAIWFKAQSIETSGHWATFLMHALVRFWPSLELLS
jgi:hypothetical protein